MLQELRIVLLDSLCLRGVLSDPDTRLLSAEQIETSERSIRETCPKIFELDLSRNLLESWVEISSICRGLPLLKSLRLK